MCFFLRKYVKHLIIFQKVQLHILNYLFMVKITEAINRLKMCHFFSYLKGKEYKHSNELCLNVFGKLHILVQTAWKSDTYF